MAESGFSDRIESFGNPWTTNAMLMFALKRGRAKVEQEIVVNLCCIEAVYQLCFMAGNYSGDSFQFQNQTIIAFSYTSSR